jgi:hypothetical protein
MRILLGIAIVLGVAAIGGLVPLTFRDQLGGVVGTAMVCDMLAAGVKLGHLNADTRKSLIDAVVAAPDIDSESKAVVARARTGCT